MTSVIGKRRQALALAGGMAALLLPRLTWAEGQVRGSSANSELLLSDSQTVVTASKSVQKISDVPAAVTVITAEQMREMGATTLLDALRYAVGVDVFEQNGSVANVSIRGFNSQYANKLLVMVDGRSIYQDFFGGVLWYVNPLLVSRVKRIEIVRGPGSALYGANAFNGVINIITKTPGELAAAPEKVTGRVITGERNTQLLETQITAGNPRDWSFSLGTGYNHTDGYGGKGTRALHDSYSTPIVTLDAEKRLRRGSLRFAAGTANATADEAETLALMGAQAHISYLTLTYAEDGVKNPLLARFYGNFSRENQRGVHYNDTKTGDGEIQQSLRLSDRHNFIYGGSFRYITEASVLTGISGHDQNLFALYGQDEWKLASKTRLFTGLRFDNHSVYGSNVTPRLSLVHHLPAAQTLRASFGTAFRAPTLNDSYADLALPTANGQTLRVKGSTDLKPEHVVNYELGYRKEGRQGSLEGSVFYNQISDLIGFAPTLAPGTPTPTLIGLHSANLGSASAFGFELEARAQLSRRLHGLVNYAYLDQQGGPQNTLTSVTPKHKINVSADWNLARHWDAFLGAHFVGGTDVLSSQQKVTLDAYTRVDARLGYRFGTAARPWSLSVTATNLFDSKHLEYPNFVSSTGTTEVAAQRRTVYVGLQGGF